MGFRLQVPAELAEQILAKHGNPVYLVSGADWEKVREVVRKNKKVNDALKAADVRLYEIDITPIVIRKGDDLAVMPPSRKRKRQ